MTAKRFKVTDNTNNPFLCDWSVTDYADGGIVHHPMTSENMANVMCGLLNELHEENEALKSSNLEYEDALGRLEEENERLENKIDVLEMEIDKELYSKLKEKYETFDNISLSFDEYLNYLIEVGLDND